MLQIAFNNFLGKSANWYKITILFFLVLNPVVFFMISPFMAGWLLLVEFVFTLALALKCYPVPSGGLLALQAVLIGLASPASVYSEVEANLPILMLLIFMVAGIYYIKDVLFLVFTKLFVTIKNKVVISLVFSMFSAVLSAFLDGLTLMAVIIAVCFNFFAIYHRVTSSIADTEHAAAEMEQFKGFLRNIIMHGALGTVLGGTMTMVGEPHNMMIATKMGWSFSEFFFNCSVISIPVSIVGFITCPALEAFKFPGYGYQLPERARAAIEKDYREKFAKVSTQSAYMYLAQGVVALLLFLALALHLAEIGLLGIAMIVILTAVNGQTKEHDLSESFTNAMPFVALMIVFFAVLAVVHDQHLIAPLTRWVFTFNGKAQLLALYIVNGLLSVISDNVFIASVFINEIALAFKNGAFDAAWYNRLAIIVNMGTNVPAIATPNGHAAFLFLLTSSLAPLINLSYMQMVKLAFPYTVLMGLTGGLAVYFFM